MAIRDSGLLGAGIMIFVALAVSTVTKFSIWFDEAFGSYLVRFDLFDLTRYTAFDVHPPLYYWLLKVWTIFFSNTELGIRSFSIFFGALTIVGAFLLTFKLFGRKAAYISLIFLVLSPMFIRYSQEARMYTLLTAIIVAATYMLVYAQQARRRWPWIVYGVLLALGMLTQYFAALAWLSHWVWWAYVAHRQNGQFRKRFFTRQWVLAHIVAIAIFLPWLPWLIRQFADVQGNGFWIPPITSMTIPDFLTNFLLFADYTRVTSWLALITYVVVLGMVGAVIVLTRRLDGRMKEQYMLLVCMVCVPVILLVLLSMPPLRPAFVDRYLMSTIVFLPMLIGVTAALTVPAARLRKGIVLIGCLGVMGLMITGVHTQMILGNYNTKTRQSNNVRQLVEKIRDRSPDRVSIIASTPWIFYEAVIYEQADSPIYFMDESTTYTFGSLRMIKENPDHKIMNMDAFARDNSSFWVIANIRGGDARPSRDGWQVVDTITINDSVSNKPLFRAYHIIVE
ncbi:MAG: glycosyltransferase family 39 protein [Candidatus Saccharimonadales bacterium]